MGARSRSVCRDQLHLEAPVFWWIVLGVAIVLFALAWWSSGRARRGVDAHAAQTSQSKMKGQVGPYSQPGGPPGIGGGSL
jgi:hypothetical protein